MGMVVIIEPTDLALLAAGKTVEVGAYTISVRQDSHFASGAELREFYTKGWDSSYYYESEDAVVQIEDEMGKWLAEDGQLYDLRQLGTLVWQETARPEASGKKPYMSFEEAFRAWKANRNHKEGDSNDSR